MTVHSASTFTNADVRLRVWFNDSVHGFNNSVPISASRQIGYAMLRHVPRCDYRSATGLQCVTAPTLRPGSRHTAAIANGAVGAINSQATPSSSLIQSNLTTMGC